MATHSFNVIAVFDMVSKDAKAYAEIETHNLELDEVANNVLYYQEKLGKITDKERTYDGICYQKFNDIVLDNLNEFELEWIDEDFLDEYDINLDTFNLVSDIKKVIVL